MSQKTKEINLMVFKGQWIVIGSKSYIHDSISSGFHNHNDCSLNHIHQLHLIIRGKQCNFRFQERQVSVCKGTAFKFIIYLPHIIISRLFFSNFTCSGVLSNSGI